jgi:hypothetical protein
MKGGAAFGTAIAIVVVACGSDGGKSESEGHCSCLSEPPSVTQTVAWDAPTSLGKTAAEAFGAVSGTCTAPLSWDATGLGGDLVITPAMESSSVMVSITVDETSARLVSSGPGGFGPPPTLMVDASVHVASDDGALVADGTSTFSYFSDHLDDRLQFTVPVDKLGGTLSITPKDPKTSVQLAFDVDAITNGCAGDVRIETAMAVGTNGGEGSSGAFASWSDTGCPVGQMRVDVDKAMITNAWGQQRYYGTWDDGTTTEFDVWIYTTPDTACLDPAFLNGNAMFTTSITYGTTDKRLQYHAASGDVNVSGGTLRSLDTTEQFTCDTSSTLPYTPDDCVSFSRVTLQLSLATSGGTLTVYEFDKNTDPTTDRADSTHEIRFDTPH